MEIWCTFSSLATSQEKKLFLQQSISSDSKTQLKYQQPIIPLSSSGPKEPDITRNLNLPETYSWQMEKQNQPPAKSAAEIEDFLGKRKIEIPNRFMDPITNTIMLKPVILPSGIRLDKQTSSFISF